MELEDCLIDSREILVKFGEDSPSEELLEEWRDNESEGLLVRYRGAELLEAYVLPSVRLERIVTLTYVAEKQTWLTECEFVHRDAVRLSAEQFNDYRCEKGI